MLTVSDYRKFAEVMAVLTEVFGDGKPPSKLKIDIYFNALKAHSICAVFAAVNQLVKERVFSTFPKPAEIIKLITGDDQDMALLSWTKIITAIARTGPYASVKFSDPVIHSVILAMGGWAHFGTFKESELVWKQKEFERYYLVLKSTKKHPAYLPGIHETHNSAMGIDLKTEIARIGFEDKPTLLPDQRLPARKVSNASN
jgi:hypothetical protein